MVTAGTGSITLVEDAARDTLAASAEFQSMVGAADATEAKDSIYFDSQPEPAAEAYTKAERESISSHALIWTDPEEDGFVLRSEAVGDSGYEFTDQSGSIKIQLCQAYPDEDRDEADRLWKNRVGTIVDEMCDLAGTGGYFAFHEVIGEGPFRTDEDDRATDGDWHFYDLTFNYHTGAEEQ